MFWLVSTASAAPAVLALTDATDPVSLQARYPEGRVVDYRSQIRGWLDMHPGADVRIDAQHDIRVSVVETEPDGAATVRSRVRGGTGTLTVDMIHVVAQPLLVPTLQTDTTVDARGQTLGFELGGAGDASSAIQQLMGGLATSGAGWKPPAGELTPGDTWELPLDLPLSMDVPLPAAARRGEPEAPSTVHVEMELTGTSRWRFEGWSSIDDVPCAVLSEGMILRGTSVASTARMVVPSGMAAERASEICWDASAGELLWQHSVAQLVQIGGPRADQRMRLHLELWVHREDEA
ncbi:MAG: hypothetical protein KTR31_00215 [Myxococcales bacterium]|nr:hypothetical protein [Myxococcales bacterium]